MGRKALKQRFDEKFIPVPESGCWLWTAGIDGKGYGQFSIRTGSHARAHRIAWELYRGNIPKGVWLLHKCDVRCCVNPDHLFFGNHDDNMADKTAKGRAAKKLTKDDVLAIRESNELGYVIAEQFGVSKSCISMIRNHKVWNHL